MISLRRLIPIICLLAICFPLTFVPQDFAAAQSQLASAPHTFDTQANNLYTTSTYNGTQFEQDIYRSYLPSITYFKEVEGLVPPVISAPANGANLTTLAPTFIWRMGIQPSGSVGCLAMGLTPNPTLCYTSFMAVDNNQWNLTMWYNLQPDKVYYWRIGVSLNGESSVAAWSQQWSFKTGPANGTTPVAPTLKSPSNNSIVSPVETFVKWNAVSGAKAYQVELHDKTTNRWFGLTTTDTQTRLSSWCLKPNSSYEWSVNARNDYAWGESSTTWNFSTSGSTSSPGSEGGSMLSQYMLDLEGNQLFFEP